jgi:hypothetical protein
LAGNSLFAQDMSINGRIVDSLNNEPLIGANVALYNRNDTVPQFFTSTDVDGIFEFNNLPTKPFRVRISYIGYKQKELRFMPNDLVNKMGNIGLQTDDKLINEVTVTGKIPPSVQLGDTTQFNANAFKTNPDANAEDLMRKMPGMTMENGQLKAQGEQVKQVTVDGKPYFGDDPNMALKNIPAYAIESVQVFDQQSEQSRFTGFDDGQTTKTVNIVIKPGMQKGFFGKAYAGYGTDNRYNAGGALHINKNKQRISLLGMSNNVSIQNFSAQDLGDLTAGSAGSGGGGRGGRGGGGMGWERNNPVDNFVSGEATGISTNHALGVNYLGFYNPKLTLQASYFINYKQNVSETSIARTNFISGETASYYDQLSEGNSNSFNQRFNVRLEWKIDSFNSITFTPKGSFQTNKSISDLNSLSSLSLNRSDTLNSSVNQYDNTMNGYNLSGEFLYRLSFRKPMRTFSLSIQPEFSNAVNDGFLVARNAFLESNMMAIDSLDQNIYASAPNNKLVVNASWSEPISKTSMLMFQGISTYQKNFRDQRTASFNDINNTYSSIDTSLSNEASNIWFYNRFNLAYRLRMGEKFNFGLNAAVQHMMLDVEQIFPAETSYSRQYWYFLPGLFMRYAPNKNTNVRTYYRASVTTPSVNQLQPVTNNSNPLQLTAGNPMLKPEFNNNVTVRYSKNNTDKNSNFNMFFNFSQSFNYLGQSRLVATADTLIESLNLLVRQGAQFTQPVNLDGYWGIRSSVSYGKSMFKNKLNANLSLGANFTQTPGLINGVLNRTDAFSIVPGITLSSNISEKLDIALSTTANSWFVNSQVQNSGNSNYYNQNSNLRFQYIFWKGFFIQGDLNHTWFSGLGEGFNQQWFLMNGSVGAKLFKNQLSEIRLSVFDVLRQNNSVNRTVSDTYIEDVKNLVLQRYFMLSFTYGFKKFG